MARAPANATIVTGVFRLLVPPAPSAPLLPRPKAFTVTKIGQLARPRAPTADAHAVQAEPPAVAPCLPIGQVVQTALLVAPLELENLPAAQAVQVALLVAPLELEYLPAAQAVQVALAAAVAYLPAGHVEHCALLPLAPTK